MSFAKRDGISEDMLSHVLAGRKDLVKLLSQALDRIGYSIEFVPQKNRRRNLLDGRHTFAFNSQSTPSGPAFTIGVEPIIASVPALP